MYKKSLPEMIAVVLKLQPADIKTETVKDTWKHWKLLLLLQTIYHERLPIGNIRQKAAPDNSQGSVNSCSQIAAVCTCTAHLQSVCLEIPTMLSAMAASVYQNLKAGSPSFFKKRFHLNEQAVTAAVNQAVERTISLKKIVPHFYFLFIGWVDRVEKLICAKIFTSVTAG